MRSYGAHPRSRGENAWSAAWSYCGGGSSPLTRGKPISTRSNASPTGLIPAHAGKTEIARAEDVNSKAHPRSRGENGVVNVSQSAIAGSSPLTRGKLTWSSRSAADAGLIPAHAGKTLLPSRSMHRMRAHPRSRGENGFIYRSEASAHGSSPLTRGKPTILITVSVFIGLIPAHAGKTQRPGLLDLRLRAHPRSRGENGQRSAAYFAAQGSSPLTRGKLEPGLAAGVVAGLIPAHAGKTFRGWRGGFWARAHPRSRGENVQGRSTALMGVGSSPLTRGKRPVSCVHC